MGILGAILGPPGDPLGQSWGHLGPWASRLGPPWGFLGPLMDHLGALLGQRLLVLGHLGLLRGYLRAFWAPSWSISGSFRITLGSSWCHVWGILCHGANIRILLCCLDLPFYLSFSCLPIPKQHLASRAQVLVRPRRGREALTIRRPVSEGTEHGVLDLTQDS